MEMMGFSEHDNEVFSLFLLSLWVLACSTIVEHSQQEGFYRVPLPAAHQTPNLEDQ